VARRTMRFRWRFLLQVAIAMGTPVLGSLVWSRTHSVWSGFGAVFAVPLAAVAVAAVVPSVRRVHRSGETVRGVLRRRRQLTLDRVDSADKLHARAPVAAGFFALVSLPAMILTLVAARARAA
jgi:hypothetical protein